MFSLFPSQWSQPVPGRFKPIKSLANHHFPPKTIKISRPASGPVKVKIPIEEMCLGENNDFTEVDKMLAEIFNNSSETKIR